MPGEYIIGQGQIKAGSNLVSIHKSATDRNAFGLKRLRPCQSVCPRSCKMVNTCTFRRVELSFACFQYCSTMPK